MRTPRRTIVGLLTITVLACCQSCQRQGVPTTTNPTSTAVPAPTPGSRSVPNVVGMRLTDAKARLSALGYSKVNLVDASGQGRYVLDADNWIVQSTSPPAGSLTALGTQITLRVVKPTDGAGAATTTPGVIPNVVCKDLQSAQDALQSAGFYNLGSADATGHGRHQLLDRDWVVVQQSIKAGTRVNPQTRILLSVVKYGEPTGASGCRS